MASSIQFPHPFTWGLTLAGMLAIASPSFAWQTTRPAAGQPNSGQAPAGQANRVNQPSNGQPGNTQPANGQPNGGQRPAAQMAQGPVQGPVQGPFNGPPSQQLIPQQPIGFPLSPDREKYVDDVLLWWEKSSAKVQRYKCTFTRWTYDPTFTQRDAKGQLPAKLVSEGEIKYAAPDKGLFKEDKIQQYVPPKTAGDAGKYDSAPKDSGDHWVCDGKSVFLFNYKEKQLIQTELPKEMQGKAIVDGPLPFMFGAEAKKVKDRFWVRDLQAPPDAKGEYWLEAIPKRQEDAANFKTIKIVIDVLKIGTDSYSLPKAMAIENRDNSSQTFAFEKRDVNWNLLPAAMNPFFKDFFEPATPLGWKKVVERYQGESAPPRVADGKAGPPSNGTAPKSTTPTKR